MDVEECSRRMVEVRGSILVQFTTSLNDSRRPAALHPLRDVSWAKELHLCFGSIMVSLDYTPSFSTLLMSRNVT
jgi:hypothetical protein